jgi:hypothetical protein
MVDLECSMVDVFHWSLFQIDETDIESLIPFIFQYPKWKEKRGVDDRRKQLFADEVDFI